MPKRYGKGDVSRYIPKCKRPIVYSTIAAKDLRVAFAEEGGTIYEVRNRINYDAEAKAVLRAYIDRGYGNQVAAEWFKN